MKNDHGIDHWNPPKVAVVLLQQGKLRLSKNVRDDCWRFPEGVPSSKDREVFETANRIMKEQFKVQIATIGIISVQIAAVDETRGQVTIYILARSLDDRTDPLPGLQLNAMTQFRLRELADGKKLGSDVQNIYSLAQAVEKD